MNPWIVRVFCFSASYPFPPKRSGLMVYFEPLYQQLNFYTIMPLTDLAIRKAAPREKEYKLTDFDGMYLLVNPNGGKYFRGNYRFFGKQKTLSLGVYPDIDLAQARIKWQEAKQKVANGEDPSLLKKEIKLKRKTDEQLTFKVVCEEWLELRKKEWSQRTYDNNKQRLENDVFPKIGHLPISKVTPLMIKEVLKAIEKRGALEICDRMRGQLRRVFEYAKVPRYITVNPVEGMEEILQTPEEGHFAAVEVEDVPKLVADIYRNNHRMRTPTRCAMHIMLRTFVRTSELIEVPWSEIDLEAGMWIIPASRMKMRRDHMVPLSRQVVALFREMHQLTSKNHYVFPSDRDPKGHLSNGAILAALNRMGYRGEMTGHGFRSVAMSTIEQELGYKHEVVDLQLSHVKKSKVDRAYDRAKWLNVRTKMMQDWSDYIDKLALAALLPTG